MFDWMALMLGKECKGPDDERVLDVVGQKTFNRGCAASFARGSIPPPLAVLKWRAAGWLCLQRLNLLIPCESIEWSVLLLSTGTRFL